MALIKPSRSAARVALRKLLLKLSAGVMTSRLQKEQLSRDDGYSGRKTVVSVFYLTRVGFRIPVSVRPAISSSVNPHPAPERSEERIP